MGNFLTTQTRKGEKGDNFKRSNKQNFDKMKKNISFN